MANLFKLSSYWRKKIQKYSGLTEFGLRVFIKKAYNKKEWTVHILDTYNDDRLISYEKFENDPVHILVANINMWTLQVMEEVIFKNGRLRHFYNRKFIFTKQDRKDQREKEREARAKNNKDYGKIQ